MLRLYLLHCFVFLNVWWEALNNIKKKYDRDNAQYIIEPDCSHKANLHL